MSCLCSVYFCRSTKSHGCANCHWQYAKSAIELLNHWSGEAEAGLGARQVRGSEEQARA